MKIEQHFDCHQVNEETYYLLVELGRVYAIHYVRLLVLTFSQFLHFPEKFEIYFHI